MTERPVLPWTHLLTESQQGVVVLVVPTVLVVPRVRRAAVPSLQGKVTLWVCSPPTSAETSKHSTLADYVDETIQHLWPDGLESPCHVVGHSMGGFGAIALHDRLAEHSCPVALTLLETPCPAVVLDDVLRDHLLLPPNHPGLAALEELTERRMSSFLDPVSQQQMLTRLERWHQDLIDDADPALLARTPGICRSDVYLRWAEWAMLVLTGVDVRIGTATYMLDAEGDADRTAREWSPFADDLRMVRSSVSHDKLIESRDLVDHLSRWAAAVTS